VYVTNLKLEHLAGYQDTSVQDYVHVPQNITLFY